jgi:uncharacterized protein YegP (UPF0339 family)
MIKTAQFEIFQSRSTGDWWWRLRAKNGKVIAGSAEGYKRKSHAITMTEKIAGQIAEARKAKFKVFSAAGIELDEG